VLSVFAGLTKEHAPAFNFEINGNPYNKWYYLADGIYLSWPTFVKTVPGPSMKKGSHFAKYQEACQKDVERSFGCFRSVLLLSGTLL
jgi:hypothetical protein